MSTNEAVSLDRTWPRTNATDELRLLREFLTFLRITAVHKIASLPPDLAAATPLATSPVMSLTGIVKHLTAVERFWLTIVGGGSDLPSLWVAEDADEEWRVLPGETPATVVAAYRREWAYADGGLAAKVAGDPAAVVVDGQIYTVRWLLTHVIQETARHVGQMDLLREIADGSTGE